VHSQRRIQGDFYIIALEPCAPIDHISSYRFNFD